MRLGLTLLCLAALVAVGSATLADDCRRAIPNCPLCRFQLYRGTVTKAICLTCDAGYKVANSGRACWCAPGYFYNATTPACQECGAGKYCPGSKATLSGATQNSCRGGLTTTTNTAKTATECVTLPGKSFAGGDCAKNSYNPGYNQRLCTPCPGGLETDAAAAQSVAQCIAPAGSYYLRGKAVKCAQGTYKETSGNRDCTACPKGFTTATGSIGSKSKADCKFLLPGWEIAADATVGVTDATLCLANYYRATKEEFTTAAILCTKCPGALVTLPDTRGATNLGACLVPPGYGVVTDAGGAVTDATICTNAYNPGYNREGCKSCGSGILAASGSTSPDDCYVPAGYSITNGPTGWVGAECPEDTYGRASPTYGLVEAACTKCPDDLHTYNPNPTPPATPETADKLKGQTGPGACLTNKGWGYGDGSTQPCDAGTWNAGYNQAECTPCPNGFTTEVDSNPLTADAGAWSSDQCKLDFGLQKLASGEILPCPRSSYRQSLEGESCTFCTAGTTLLLYGSRNATDCNVCLPGTGGDSCATCTSGSFAPGYEPTHAACHGCAAAYTNAVMVSRAGSTSQDDCIAEFNTAPDAASNYMPWDYIPFNTDKLTPVNNPVPADEAACQAACHSDAACQYFEWHGVLESGLGTKACLLRKVGTGVPAAIDMTTPAAVTNAVAFEIKEGLYALYPTLTGDADDIGGIGTPYNGTVTAASGAFADVKKWCDTEPSCIGLKKGAAGDPWKAFKGALMEGYDAKIRVYGAALNPWASPN